MTTTHTPDSAYAWYRLGISLAVSTISGIGLWAYVVILPTIQAEFGLDRAGASLPYTVTTIGFALGGILMGRLSDRFGITVPLVLAAVAMGAGFILDALSGSFTQFVIIQGLLIGILGSAAAFGPLIADVSQWFLKSRGFASPFLEQWRGVAVPRLVIGTAQRRIGG